jgi:monovalent cation:H+ antiporter-2, CPA2 family
LVIEIGQIIHDFAIIMIVAAVMSLLSYKLKQPMVIGYIIAGMIIGPFAFNFIFNVEVLNLLAEIGIVLLLLVVGMEFPLEKLKKIGRKAFVIAVSEALGTFVGGYAVAYYALNFSFFDSLFLALAISVTSSVLVMRVLEELNVLREESSLLILGVCVIEDIVVISMLAILQSIASTGHLSMTEIGISVGSVLVFIFGTIIIGSKIVPRIVNFIGRLNKPDLLIITILGIVFTLSYIAYEIGISIATGAFFAGVLIAGSKVQVVTKVMATPIRDMFTALFFVSVGALMDITLLPIFIIPAIILILVSVGAKLIAVYVAAKTQGFDRITSIRTAFSLSSSGGELALVTAKAGTGIGVTSSFILPMVGAMTIITTFLSPYLIKVGWNFRDLIKRGGETM